jgi:hypothetical protein
VRDHGCRRAVEEVQYPVMNPPRLTRSS